MSLTASSGFPGTGRRRCSPQLSSAGDSLLSRRRKFDEAPRTTCRASCSRDGHWDAETAPDEMLAALTAFLTPYRNASDRRNAVAADSRLLR
jgi:hypothetical protein